MTSGFVVAAGARLCPIVFPGPTVDPGGTSAGLQEVEILRPEGLRLSDVRPMARLNISVIVEQAGRLDQIRTKLRAHDAGRWA